MLLFPPATGLGLHANSRLKNCRQWLKIINASQLTTESLMKLNYFCILLLTLLLAGCETETAKKEISPVTLAASESATKETASSTLNSPDGYLIDVRSQKEWDAGHVESAIHIPHTEIVEGIAKVTEDKNAKIYLHCKVGGRAGTAMKALEEAGYTNVENLGGMDDAKAHVGIED